MNLESVTHLLQRMDAGERGAADELYSLLYGELYRRARGLVGRGAEGTLGPTAVVHEAWLKLAGGEGAGWTGKAHFLAVSAKAMRSVLVDHARARATLKRGARGEHLALDDTFVQLDDRELDVLELDDALRRLAEVDPELARLVELRFFTGLTIADTAAAIGRSTATVERDWKTARAWLRTALGPRHAP